MQKITLAVTALTIALAAQSVNATQEVNAKLIGKAGAGYATGNFIESALINPSMSASFDKTDDFAVLINVAALGVDEGETLDQLDDLQDRLPQLSNERPFSQQNANTLIGLMKPLANQKVYAQAGASVAFAFPNKVLAATVFIRSRARVAGMPHIEQSDFNAINAKVGEDFNSQLLNSDASARGVMLTEVGVALAKSYPLNDGQLLLGVTPKHVKLETLYYRDGIRTFDSGDIDRDKISASKRYFTFDAGVTYLKGPMRYALVADNIVGDDLIDTAGETVNIAPQATAAIGYDGHWYSLEAALDLASRKNYALQEAVRYARVGLELGKGWASLRLGYKADLEDTLPNTYSVGLGLVVLDSLNLDLAVTTGNGDTYGGAFQLGLVF